MTDFKTIPLDDIHPDPNQPRKFYDELAMSELTQSVKEKGVLQPILLRPNGNGYLLVCGERRYRASKEAGLADIPAVIRQLTNEEALELQIIENLQRKDVHPMEEAVAFKSLLERKERNLTVEEIANRIGKKVFYVRQRLKLNNLTKEWQEAYFHNLVSGSYVTAISLFTTESQKQLAKEHQLSDHLVKGARVNENTWTLNKFRGDLKKATFDLSDPSLSPMGPCTTCPYNSAVASLFPEDANHPVCNKISDYVLKTDIAFERNLKAAIEDPGTILISRSYYADEKELKKFEKDGARVYKYQEYEVVEAPEPPDWEEINNDDELTEEGKKKELEESTARYEAAKEKFDKKIAGGKFLKGFVVIAGHGNLGETVYVTITKKGSSASSSKAVAEKEKEGSLALVDIESEITRLRDREKRNKELDGEKVHAVVKEILKKSDKFITRNRDHELTQNEITAAAAALFEGGSYEFKKWFAKHFGVDNYNLKPSHIEKIGNLTYLGLNEVIWHFILDKLVSNGGSRTADGNALCIHRIAEDYHSAEVNEAVSKQQEKAERRQKTVNMRIAELQAKKKELQAAAAIPAKETKSKSSSKKSKS